MTADQHTRMPNAPNHGRVAGAGNWRRDVITPAQSLEARKLLGWSRDRLAPRCGMPAERLRLFEIGGWDLPPEDHIAIRRTLEAVGVEFTNGGELGVRLKRSSPRKDGET